MENISIIDHIENLLKSSTDKWMIQDDNGKLHELDKRIAGKLIKVNDKGELYKLLFGKPKVNVQNLIDLDKVITEVFNYAYENLSYTAKINNAKQLRDIEKKYKLRRFGNVHESLHTNYII